MAERQQSPEVLFQDAEETIEGIVRKKFRVSLSPADGRLENQNARDFCQQVKLLLWEKLTSQSGELVRDVRGYAAVLTYNQCSQRLRYQNPEWNSLKNRLRYFFGENPDYGLWENEAGDLACGFAGWRGHQPAAAADLERLQSDIWAALPAGLRGKTIRQLKRDDWQSLLETLFNHLAAPVDVDELVTIVADAFGVEEVKEQSASSAPSVSGEGAGEHERRPIDYADTGQSPEDELRRREYLRKLWDEICQLKPNQRLAYLLNFRDADGDLQIFPVNGVVSLAELGRVLQISDAQFARAWEELPLDEVTRGAYRVLASYDEKFAALTLHIPLEDLLIANLLGGERQQVINLRRLARERLVNRLKAYW